MRIYTSSPALLVAPPHFKIPAMQRCNAVKLTGGFHYGFACEREENFMFPPPDDKIFRKITCNKKKLLLAFSFCSSKKSTWSILKWSLPGDSMWPFYPLFGGHLAFQKVTWPSQKGRKDLPGAHMFLSPPSTSQNWILETPAGSCAVHASLWGFFSAAMSDHMARFMALLRNSFVVWGFNPILYVLGSKLPLFPYNRG